MQLIEEAVLDAYTEDEQAAGFLTMIEEACRFARLRSSAA
jgi:hypothetical protein